jgi:hypothetical protein
MNVIRYFDTIGAFATLAKRRLRLARVTNFNDPFELALLWTDPLLEQTGRERVQALVDQNLRILCTCSAERLEPQGDVLMWSHYGEGHSGVRIHFDKAYLEGLASVSWDVEYSAALPCLSVDRVSSHLDMGASDLQTFEALSLGLRSKGKFWSYEREVRFFFERDQCTSWETMACSIPIEPDAVKRVDLGLRVPEKCLKRIRRLLRSPEYAHTEAYRALQVPGLFAIQYRPLD